MPRNKTAKTWDVEVFDLERIFTMLESLVPTSLFKINHLPERTWYSTFGGFFYRGLP